MGLFLGSVKVIQERTLAERALSSPPASARALPHPRATMDAWAAMRGAGPELLWLKLTWGWGGRLSFQPLHLHCLAQFLAP